MIEKCDELGLFLFSYDLNESCNVYLKFMNNIVEIYKYFKVNDINEKLEKLNEDCLVKMIDDVKLCLYNIEVLYDINIDENGISFCDFSDNIYLDVINEKNVEYSYLGENFKVYDEMSDNIYLDVIDEFLDKDELVRIKMV